MQGEEGALSLTTKEQSPDAVVKGRPLNYCAGFRPQKIANEQCRNPDGKPFPYNLELHFFSLEAFISLPEIAIALLSIDVLHIWVMSLGFIVIMFFAIYRPITRSLCSRSESTRLWDCTHIHSKNWPICELYISLHLEVKFWDKIEVLLDAKIIVLARNKVKWIQIFVL